MTFLREMRRLLVTAAATAIASTAFFAAPTQAATVTLGSGCTSGATYTGVTVDANGNFTLTCIGGGGGVGTVGFSPTTYSVLVGSQTALSVTRTGGSTGAVGANLTVSSGNCTLAAPSVSFAAGDATTKTVNINGNGVGACTVSMLVTGGAVSGSTTATVDVVPADNPGTFGLSVSNASVPANTNVTVQLTRTGGTTGTYDVAFSLTPTSLTGVTATPPSPVRFNSGEGTKTITVNTGSLVSPATQGSVVLAITGATPVAPTTATATFAGTATIPVGGTTCAAPPSNAVQLANFGNEGSWSLVNLANGQIGYIPLPTLPPLMVGATITQTQTQGSGEITKIEIGISKCPGDIMYGAPTALGGSNNQQRFGYSPCYTTSTQVSNNSLNWHLDVPNHYAFCYSPVAEGPWYVNVRYTLPGCSYGQGNCGASFQWNRR